MKKLCLMIAGLILISAGAAMAVPERAGHFDVGVNVAGAIPTDGDASAGVQVGGSVDYGVNEWLAVGFSGGWQRMKLKTISESGVTINGTDLNGIPLFGNIIFRAPMGNQRFTPYGVVGLGAVFWSVDDTTGDYEGEAFDVSSDVNTTFAIKLGGGVDCFLTDNWIMNLEAAYVFSRADATQTVTVDSESLTVTDDVKLDYWTVGGGLKYRY